MSFGAFVPLPTWGMKLRPYRSALPLMLQRQKGLPPFMPEFAVLSGGLRSETTADDLKTTHLGEVFAPILLFSKQMNFQQYPYVSCPLCCMVCRSVWLQY